jgi:serine phosphatase RsbU (regulator of sigma subunit)
LEQASHANRALYQQFGEERFVTGQVLRLDVPGGPGRWSTPATRCPGWYDAAGSSRSGWTPDLPLGVDPDAVYQFERLTLEPGDRLVLLGDGVLEATPEGGSAYGASQLHELVLGSQKLAPFEVGGWWSKR